MKKGKDEKTGSNKNIMELKLGTYSRLHYVNFVDSFLQHHERTRGRAEAVHHGMKAA